MDFKVLLLLKKHNNIFHLFKGSILNIIFFLEVIKNCFEFVYYSIIIYMID